jgi:hypothetical protein
MAKAPWIFIRSRDPQGTAVYTSKHLSPDAAIASIHNMMEKARRTGVILDYEIELNLRAIDPAPIIIAVAANRAGDPGPNPLSELEAAIARFHA